MAEASDTTRAAIAAIGEGAPDDFRLTPERHAEALPSEAGALRRVLRRKTIEPLVEGFVDADRKAGRAQFWFKTLGRAGAYLRLAPVVLGALLLLVATDAFGLGRWLDGQVRPFLSEGAGRLMTWLAFIQLLSLFLASAVNWILSRGRFFEGWMRRRTAAETVRLEFFYRVTAAREPVEPAEIAFLPLQLEYFRRYQLDVQRAYYRIRAAEHAAAAGQTRSASVFYALLTLFAAVPLGYAAIELFEPGLLAPYLELTPALELLFVAVGMIAAGLGSAAAEIARLNLHERNAIRYKLVSEDLEQFAEEPLATARKAAAAGDREAVAFFVDTVQSLVSSENQEWIHLWRVRQRLHSDHE